MTMVTNLLMKLVLLSLLEPDSLCTAYYETPFNNMIDKRSL